MRRTSLTRLVVLAGTGIALILLPSILHPVPALVWNASPSVPVGLYRVAPDTPRRGDFALVRTPESVATLAAQRGYLPIGVPLVKRIAAMQGDYVCAHEKSVSVNGETIAQQRERDSAERPLSHWSECRTLHPGEVFLLASTPDSFDSRYFGPVQSAALIGRLVPLWTK